MVCEVSPGISPVSGHPCLTWAGYSTPERWITWLYDSRWNPLRLNNMLLLSFHPKTIFCQRLFFEPRFRNALWTGRPIQTGSLMQRQPLVQPCWFAMLLRSDFTAPVVILNGHYLHMPCALWRDLGLVSQVTQGVGGMFDWEALALKHMLDQVLIMNRGTLRTLRCSANSNLSLAFTSITQSNWRTWYALSSHRKPAWLQVKPLKSLKSKRVQFSHSSSHARTAKLSLRAAQSLWTNLDLIQRSATRFETVTACDQFLIVSTFNLASMLAGWQRRCRCILGQFSKNTRHCKRKRILHTYVSPNVMCYLGSVGPL
jgi:hypothetical protein